MAPDVEQRIEKAVRQRGGWVYVAQQGAYLKIGCTRKQPAIRIAQLNQTGTIHPWELVAAHWFLDGFAAEKQVHKALQVCRIKAEIFMCTADVGHDALNAQIQQEARQWGCFLNLDAIRSHRWADAIYFDELLNLAGDDLPESSEL